MSSGKLSLIQTLRVVTERIVGYVSSVTEIDENELNAMLDSHIPSIGYTVNLKYRYDYNGESDNGRVDVIYTDIHGKEHRLELPASSTEERYIKLTDVSKEITFGSNNGYIFVEMDGKVLTNSPFVQIYTLNLTDYYLLEDEVTITAIDVYN